MPVLNTHKTSVALVIGHMAGMIDLASLPVWVGTLISGYHYKPAEAGGLVTLFLIGVVVASAVVSHNFHRLPVRWLPSGGFLAAAAAFFALSRAEGFQPFLALHFLAGLAVGTALSVVHGTMGKTRNPHRIFAIGGFGFGCFAVAFLGGTPVAIANHGPQVLFLVFAVVMSIAAVVTAVLFPNRPQMPVDAPAAETHAPAHVAFTPTVWLIIAGIVGMNLNQAMAFSFVERIGMDRGFGIEQVQLVLILLGLTNLVPTLIAAATQKKFAPLRVGMTGALLQAVLAISITTSTQFVGFALPTMFYAFVMLFSHTFLFGHLAAIDRSGRAVAATPAMTMSGSALAPLIGGILVETTGYPGIGMAVGCVSVVVITLFALAARRAPVLAH